MALQFDNRVALEKWVKTRSREEAVVLAVRSALRVAPLVKTAVHVRPRRLTISIGAVFRCLSLTWVAAKYPVHANAAAARAGYAFAAAFTADAAARAAYGAARAAYAFADTGAAARAFRGASGAARAAYAAYAADAADAAAHAATANAEQMLIWTAVGQDAEVLYEGGRTTDLSAAPLWPAVPPMWFIENSARLFSALPADENWKVWAEWLDRRVTGGACDEAYELVYVHVPDEEWEKGPAAANLWIKEHLPIPLPAPIPNIVSVFGFGWNAANRIAISNGSQNTPAFPFPGNEDDHKSRLEACRLTVERLICGIQAKKFNIRPDYLESLQGYAENLPRAPGSGNFLLADMEARFLRDLFASETNVLPKVFAGRLKGVLELHLSLRVYHPETGRFYHDVGSGRLAEPLPLDAVERTARTVAENSPRFFEPDVRGAFRRIEKEPPAISLEPDDIADHHEEVIKPPPDPLGNLDPKKSHDFAVASAINKLWEVALKGKELPLAMQGWSEVLHKLGESVGPVLDWLSRFTGN